MKSCYEKYRDGWDIAFGSGITCVSWDMSLGNSETMIVAGRRGEKFEILAIEPLPMDTEITEYIEEMKTRIAKVFAIPQVPSHRDRRLIQGANERSSGVRCRCGKKWHDTSYQGQPV